MALTLPRFKNVAQLVKAADNQPALVQGAKGPGVQALQLALIELGFPMPLSTHHGNSLPDGIFGSETLRTVQAFQRQNGLVVDGAVGRMTLQRLEARILVASELRAQQQASQQTARNFRSA